METALIISAQAPSGATDSRKGQSRDITATAANLVWALNPAVIGLLLSEKAHEKESQELKEI